MTDNSEDLDIAMLMYNLFEYSHNCFMTSGSLWNYYKDEIDEINVNNNASDTKSFKYKTKIVGETAERPAQPENQGDAEQSAQPPVPTLNG